MSVIVIEFDDVCIVEKSQCSCLVERERERCGGDVPDYRENEWGNCYGYNFK